MKIKFPLGLREQDERMYERGWNDAIKAAAKIAEQREKWLQTREMTDHNDLYTGHYETIERVTPKWRDGTAIATAIRSAASCG